MVYIATIVLYNGQMADLWQKIFFFCFFVFIFFKIFKVFVSCNFFFGHYLFYIKYFFLFFIFFFFFFLFIFFFFFFFSFFFFVFLFFFFFFFNDTATTEIYTLSLHDALPISSPFVMILPYIEQGD